MMVLTVAVTLVGTLCVLDLLMTFGVVRRLREHTTMLDGMLRGGGGPAAAGGPPGPVIAADVPAPGYRVGEFSATTVDGAPLSRDLLPDNHVAVFLAADCTSCREQVPALVSWAAAQDRASTLVIIDGQMTDPGDLVAALGPVATVVVQTSGTPVTDAYDVQAFPSFCVIADGAVTFASLDFVRLPAAV